MSSNFDEEADVRGFLGDTQEEFEGESSNGGLEVITTILMSFFSSLVFDFLLLSLLFTLY